jgi:hypothetical protein
MISSENCEIKIHVIYSIMTPGFLKIDFPNSEPKSPSNQVHQFVILYLRSQREKDLTRSLFYMMHFRKADFCSNKSKTKLNVDWTILVGLAKPEWNMSHLSRRRNFFENSQGFLLLLILDYLFCDCFFFLLNMNTCCTTSQLLLVFIFFFF